MYSSYDSDSSSGSKPRRRRQAGKDPSACVAETKFSPTQSPGKIVTFADEVIKSEVARRERRNEQELRCDGKLEQKPRLRLPWQSSEAILFGAEASREVVSKYQDESTLGTPKSGSPTKKTHDELTLCRTLSPTKMRRDSSASGRLKVMSPTKATLGDNYLPPTAKLSEGIGSSPALRRAPKRFEVALMDGPGHLHRSRSASSLPVIVTGALRDLSDTNALQRTDQAWEWRYNKCQVPTATTRMSSMERILNRLRCVADAVGVNKLKACNGVKVKN